MNHLHVDAILFDMDGTLIDVNASYREAVRMTAKYLLGENITTEEVDEVKRLPGFNNDWDATWAIVRQRVEKRITVPTEAERRSPAYERLRAVFQTYYLGDRLWSRQSGTEPLFAWSEPLIRRETSLVTFETLERLRAFRLGIATSRPRSEAQMAVHQHALERYFPETAIVGLEDAPDEKPHPAPLQELVLRLRCHRPVYVGDTVNDALAALAAGMAYIHIGSSPLADRAAEQHIHTRVSSVNEVPDICLPLFVVGALGGGEAG